MEYCSFMARDYFLSCVSEISSCKAGVLVQFVVLANCWCVASGLGSMSVIAIAYGEDGSVFCGLKSDGSHLVACYGSNSAVVYGTPARFRFFGITAGQNFVCGLLMESKQPYCWGSSEIIQMGVPQPMAEGAKYVEISAGDYHLCGLRMPLAGAKRNLSLVDCWGYNMTRNYVFDAQIQSLSAGAEFTCGLFSQNRTAYCWGDESNNSVIRLLPKATRFQKIAAGGFHVCGILEGANSRPSCWGSGTYVEEEISGRFMGQKTTTIVLPSKDPMISVVGGKFHTCGIKRLDNEVICWGLFIEPSIPAPRGVKVYDIAAGDYFTCGILAEKSLAPYCWGNGFPSSLPVPISAVLCKRDPCPPEFYELSHEKSPCKSPNLRICLPCSRGCPAEMYQISECTLNSDLVCQYNCSNCSSAACFSNCSSTPVETGGKKKRSFWSLRSPFNYAEVAFALVLVFAVSLGAYLYVRWKLRKYRCLATASKAKKNENVSSTKRHNEKVPPEQDEFKVRRARTFTYEELFKATGGFKEEALVGKGSFSCVFKGVLNDGTMVAVKRAIKSSDKKKRSEEFRTELDLLSRLNHAHLLNLLGYCDENGERLLVYEYMAHGSLHEHLHRKDKTLKEQMGWIRRVTIAVQAAKGIEYLHGYACPPVIHRDIKSSNILIDEEHNARVADFGLSLLGPTDSDTPLSEMPAGTIGYLDPEYYRLHYLTTKSDVYSFGVVLLEILSGRKVVDMEYGESREANIVEWAVPLIRSGDISAILDPVLEPPSDLEAIRRIANVACKCVRMRGKERPSMDKVTTALERALAQLMGTPCIEQPILPTEVVLGSSRLHKKSSQRSSNRSFPETEAAVTDDQRYEFRAPSWITFPSVASSHRRKSSVSDADIEGKNLEPRNVGSIRHGDGLGSLEEEIGPASPQENMFLRHNF